MGNPPVCNVSATAVLAPAFPPKPSSRRGKGRATFPALGLHCIEHIEMIIIRAAGRFPQLQPFRQVARQASTASRAPTFASRLPPWALWSAAGAAVTAIYVRGTAVVDDTTDSHPGWPVAARGKLAKCDGNGRTGACQPEEIEDSRRRRNVKAYF